MKALSRDENKAIRLMGIEELKAYLGVGRNTADKVGTAAGAKRKIGKRALYDRQVIDKYIDGLGA